MIGAHFHTHRTQDLRDLPQSLLVTISNYEPCDIDVEKLFEFLQQVFWKWHWNFFENHMKSPHLKID